jgi:hypothetical protein
MTPPAEKCITATNSGANLLPFCWILNRRLKGSMSFCLRMRRNCFDHVPDIFEQQKTAHWIDKSSIFNMICKKQYYRTDRSEIAPGNNTLKFE